MYEILKLQYQQKTRVMEVLAANNDDIVKRWSDRGSVKTRSVYKKHLEDVLASICQETGAEMQKGIEIVRSDNVTTYLAHYFATKTPAMAKRIVSAVQSFRNFDLPHPAKPLSWKEEEEVSPASVESLPSPYGAIAILLNQTGWEYSYLQGNLPDAIDLTSCPSWMGFGTLKSGFPQASAVSEALKVQGLTVRMLRFAQRIDVSTDRMQSIGTLERRGRPQEKPQKVIKDKRISLTDEQFRHQLASSHLTTTRRPTILDLNPEIRSSADLVPPMLDGWLYNRLKARMIELHDTKKKERQSEADKEAEFGSLTRETEMPEGEREGDTDEEAVSDEPAYQAEWMHYEVPAREESAFGEEVDLCKSADEEPKIDHDEHGGEVAGRDGDGEIQENVIDEERSESDTADSIVFFLHLTL
ncbi:retinal rod [Carpediemonas membranifera]|uniref:Retinal rod n=1 Tax=Carpediemonas membranifera TaxID=201153 RepID=A0A8J6AS51_9EUKA|nr:retinal rod [Carpediemonas membranifera]|eukprot:KAG9390935.1 retinal rod [Carpediemonas membranifera]